MKDRVKVIFLVVFLILIFPRNANAVGICPAKTISKLQTEALKVKIEYVKAESYDGTTKFRFVATNLGENLVIHFNDNEYGGSENYERVEINGLYADNKEYLFEIHSANLKTCGQAYLITKKVTIPKYNIYSEYEECVEYEEFELCQPWYKGEIKDSKDFFEQLSEYKKSIAPEKEKFEDNRNIIQKILDWCKDNIEITVAVIAVIVLIIVILIVRKIIKIKKRVKIKL